MNRKEIEREIEDLKADHMRLSADMEKLVYVKSNTHFTELELERLEKEISDLRKKLQSMNEEDK
ncbi:phage host-nuclease inhibitor protein Gam [Gracilibacillus halotolerans]|uniref:Phage host-nuclease inhibitor protein Gam n=1 Tax=Gracilibacillus halotolerans TaxID=74386 RepID=A0A841RK11_9BACI|nr:SE1832 family protein [Gracilibacillus halotolerans]MBB6513041.1 phage host-nuclease inhibitor protein Gam [Gracilibacillus halotolerans]